MILGGFHFRKSGHHRQPPICVRVQGASCQCRTARGVTDIHRQRASAGQVSAHLQQRTSSSRQLRTSLTSPGPFMRCWAREDGPALAHADAVGVNSKVGWVEFDALIEPMPWGRNVYTILRLDETLTGRAAVQPRHNVRMSAAISSSAHADERAVKPLAMTGRPRRRTH